MRLTPRWLIGLVAALLLPLAGISATIPASAVVNAPQSVAPDYDASRRCVSSDHAPGLVATSGLAVSSFGPVAGLDAAKSGLREGPGAMTRLKYEPASYHGKVDTALKSRAPAQGQDALDFSLQVKETSPRRVGIDPQTSDFVIFDQTTPGVFHGHVRPWNELPVEAQNALRKAGMVDAKGRIQ